MKKEIEMSIWDIDELTIRQLIEKLNQFDLESKINIREDFSGCYYEFDHPLIRLIIKEKE